MFNITGFWRVGALVFQLNGFLFQWEVGAAVLEIFHKLLSAYEVIGEDFLDKQYEVQGEGILAANKPPGFVLMVHMMSESGMLKMVGSYSCLSLLVLQLLDT